MLLEESPNDHKIKVINKLQICLKSDTSLPSSIRWTALVCNLLTIIGPKNIRNKTGHDYDTFEAVRTIFNSGPYQQ